MEVDIYGLPTKKRESAQKGIRRIVCEQIDRALSELNDETIALPEVIHQIRKRCKMIRAVLRLTRDRTDNYYILENARYSHAAKLISEMRDAQAFIETYDALADHFARKTDQCIIRSVRVYLEKRRDIKMLSAERPAGLLNTVRIILKDGRIRVKGMNIDNAATSLEAGMRRTFTKAQSAMENARLTHMTEHFHQWRKHTKYHCYHMRLLIRLAEKSVSERRSGLTELEEDLGLFHNLCLLRILLKKQPEYAGGRSSFHTFYKVAGEWMNELKSCSLEAGGDLFSKTPAILEKGAITKLLDG